MNLRYPARILFLAPDVRLTEQDGQAVHTLSLCKALATLVSEVLLLVADSTTQESLPAGVRVEQVPNTGRTAIRAATEWGETWHPDVIYERRSDPKLGGRLSRSLRIPYYLEVNGLADMEQSWASGIRTRAVRRIRRPAYRSCRRIFVPTAKLGTYVAHAFGIEQTRISVIPNGVDLERFIPMDMQAARRALGWSAEWKTVTFVGKLVPWQGLACLVRAAGMLSDIKDLRIFIVGDGPLRSTLDQQLRSAGLNETVQLAGTKPHSEVPTWIAASDVCVAPFTRVRNELIELSPLKLFEYMAMGRPIITTEVPGVRDLVDGAGVVVRPDSASDLAEAIDRLLSSPLRIRELGNRGAHLARECSWNFRAVQIVDALRLDQRYGRRMDH